MWVAVVRVQGGMKVRKPALSTERVHFLLDLIAIGASKQVLCEEIMMTDAEMREAQRGLPATERRAVRRLKKAIARRTRHT